MQVNTSGQDTRTMQVISVSMRKMGYSVRP